MILVVGAGDVGTALDAYSDVRLYPSSVWDGYSEERRAVVFKDADIFVNAVALNGAGKCADAGFDEVMSVNVWQALGYAEQARAHHVPCVLLSSMGVYAVQSCPQSVVETGDEWFYTHKQTLAGDVYPHNLYTASKILMEQVARGKAHVLRIPWFLPTLEERAASWTTVQDTYCSVISPQRLRDCLLKLVDAPMSLYQCHSGINYLPDMFPELPVRTEVPVGMTSAVPLYESRIFKG